MIDELRGRSSVRMRAPAAGVALAMLAGCVVQPPAEQQMLELASALTKLASALEAEVRFGELSEPISEAALLEQATARDPQLLAPFAGYRIRARRVGNFSSVLMCSRDGSTALLEDAGCTARFDAHLWSQSPSLSCEFRLDLTKVCGRAD